ncbi:MAG: hypothetical protein WBW01_14730 [Terriglobales bacterium]
MFRVLPDPGRHGFHYFSLAQFRMIGTVVIGKDLIGLRGGNGFVYGYNPFDLYGTAERERGKPLPPHLVFAELDKEEPDDACAFLNAYGPLEGTNSFLPPTFRERQQWETLRIKSPSPDEYFHSKLGEAPLLPVPPSPEEDFYSYPLTAFWKAQSEFELALRLHAALDARTDQLQKIKQILRVSKLKLKGSGPKEEHQYIDVAQTLVMKIMNVNLSTLQPRVVKVPNTRRVTSVWGCYSLLEAMYLMLFLDITGWRGRIAQCGKCGLLFYTTLDKGKYCTTVCENRARALRAYYQNKKGGS